MSIRRRILLASIAVALPLAAIGAGFAAAAVVLVVAGLLWHSLSPQTGALRQAAVEIAVLQAAHQTLQQSLDEKELLLREVHHRIKNNLQAVSSLLDLQARSLGDALLMEKLAVSQNRIRCMALVHEQLYGAGRFDRIAARDYLSRLASHLVDGFGRARSVRLRTELEDLKLDVDRAMTVGLLANELLSNALKHAFPADRRGEVRLTLASRGPACVLTVADDGVGMPPEPQPEDAGCLGMSLVRALASQLHGSVSVDGRRGTCVRVTFPLGGGVQPAVAS